MNLTAEQQVWFDAQTSTPENVNPCVRLYGRGPAGQSCRGCVHLVARRSSKTYWKCDLRRITNGPATDHRVRWAACAKWEERKP